MSKEYIELALNGLTVVDQAIDKVINYKNSHDMTVERMHKFEMNGKKERLEMVLVFAAPLVSATAFFINRKASVIKAEKNVENESEMNSEA